MRRIVLLLASGALAVLLSAGATLAVAPGAVLDAHTTSYEYAGWGCGGQPNLRKVQTLEAQNTGLLSDAQARIFGFPETTGDVTAEIVTIPTPDNPSQVLGEASIPASSVGVGVFVGDDVENSPMVNFSFAEGVPVTAGQSYGLRISNNVCWIMADYTTAQDLDAYPDGKWVVDPGNGSPWIVSSHTRDGVFAIYVVPTNAPDADGDGVLDVTDNCPGVANANQADFDNDGEGDVCDGDRDGDGAPNDSDYAPDDPNVQNPPDTTAPRVDAVSPADGKTGVARGTNLRATFSEQMDPASISKSTFRLFKCPSKTSTNCTTQVTNATVAPSEDGLSATLDPYGASPTKLGAKTKYKAVVTTGVKDVAGNALDQNSATAGNQQKAWYFTTGSM